MQPIVDSQTARDEAGGRLRILEAAEQKAARNLADKVNRGIHTRLPHLDFSDFRPIGFPLPRTFKSNVASINSAVRWQIFVPSSVSLYL